jgi:bacteriocin-associated integral membrane protein
MHEVTTYLTHSNQLVYLVVFILLIYYVFNTSKRIGIIKMHGVSNLYLWFIVVGKLLAVLFVFTTVAALLAALFIRDTHDQFVIVILTNQFKVFGIMFALSLVAYIYISQIKVIDALKNRKDTNGIFALNTLLKAFCSVLLILTSLSVGSQYNEIRAQQEILKNWECSKDFGVFYPFSIGYDSESFKQRSHGPMLAADDELYLYLNRMGALLINTSQYEEMELICNKNWNGIRSISVNPNYLQAFPVYDIHRQTVQISEDCTDWILLVPEKYKEREREILSFFQAIRAGFDGVEGFYQFEERVYERVVPNRVKNQQLKIIWLVNEQRIFSFNPDVFPQENNIIIDPIIQVVTEQNSLLADRNCILGTGANDPIKMKLIDRDARLTYQTILPELKRLKLDDNIQQLVMVDQLVLQEIYRLQEYMNQVILVSLGLLTALLLLVLQNLIIFFSKNQYRFVVRRLFGIGFFRTYKEYFWLFSGTWILQILICCIARWRINTGLMPALEKMPRIIDAGLICAVVGVITLELVATIIALGIIEHKNKIKILKRGA